MGMAPNFPSERNPRMPDRPRCPSTHGAGRGSSPAGPPTTRAALLAVAALALLGLASGEAQAAPSASPTTAAPRQEGRFTRVVQPELEAFFRFPAARRFRGRQLPGGPDAAEALERVGVSVRLDGAEALRHLLDAEDDHLRCTRVDGVLARLGSIVAVRVTRQGLARLGALQGVMRVELDMLSPLPAPLDHTAAEIQTHAVWASLDTAGLPVTGAGVIIADLDSGIDLFHPAFFRADGPWVDWIDVDGDGRFTPGLDAVDWNANGVADADEAVGFFDGVAYNLRQFVPILDTEDGLYDLGWDHLFLDPDGDARRSFGPEEGYDDETPTFGEPLLVPDDVNRNGRLDPGERLVALESPKIRAVRSGTRTYQRGVDLSEVPVTEDAMHGTGVSGILVGGQRGFSTLTGIAPEADLLLASTHDPDNPSGDLVPLLTWSAQQGARVMLHEYAPWVGYHLDGSSNHEQLMDQAAAQGIAQVNPAGNLGGSKKHALAPVPTRASLDLPLVLPTETAYRFLQLGLLWRAPARNLHLALLHPGGERMELGAEGTGQNGQVFGDGTTWVYAWREDSPRGTAKLEAWVFGEQGGSYPPIASGEWTLTLSDPETADASAPDVPVAAYVMDDVSGWGLGAHFPLYTSEAHLVCFPATADSAIGVAAYVGHAGAPYTSAGEVAGQLRRFSGRGLRIDGASVLDIAAPDNPLSPLSRADYGSGAEVGLGSYVVFGGTSGAGPHVAGAAVLLKQLHPELTGAEVRAALREGALVDAQVTGDASHPVEQLWGAGKLRIHQALYAATPAPNTPPSITFPSPDLWATAGAPLLLRPTLADAEDAPGDLQVRWDDGYDGTWDLGPAPLGQGREVTFSAPGTYLVKAQVVDTGGLTAEALARVRVTDDPTCDGGLCPDGGPPGPGGGGSGCGCQASSRPGSPAGDAGVPLVLLLFALPLSLLLRRRRRWRLHHDR